MNIIKNIVLGFIAGAIAAFTVYELFSWIFGNYWTPPWPRPAWSFEPADFWGVPRVLNDVLIGGLWGALFGLILGTLPEGMLTFRGAILGLFIPALLAALLITPLISGEGVLLDGDVGRIIPPLVIWTAWGAFAAWLYGFFQYGRLP